MYIVSYEVHYTLVINDIETSIQTIVTFHRPIKDHSDIYKKAESQLNEMLNIPIRTLREAHDYSYHPA